MNFIITETELKDLAKEDFFYRTYAQNGEDLKVFEFNNNALNIIDPTLFLYHCLNLSMATIARLAWIFHKPPFWYDPIDKRLVIASYGAAEYQLKEIQKAKILFYKLINNKQNDNIY